MRTLLLLCALVAYAAGAGYQLQQNGFKPGHKYWFEVRSRALSSINEVGDQYVGVLVRARMEVAVDRQRPYQLNAKLHDARWAQVHEALPQGWDAPVPAPRWQDLPLRNTRFALDTQRRGSAKIIVNAATSTSDCNLLRAIVSPFILDVPFNGSGSQTLMEESVLGEYSTRYDVAPLPRYILQAKEELAPYASLSNYSRVLHLVKTVDFNKTKRHNVYHVGLAPAQLSDIGDSDAGAIKRMAITRSVIVNNTVHSSVSTSQLELSPLLYTQQKSKVNSRMNLTLVDQEAGSVEAPSNPEKRSIQLEMIPDAKSLAASGNNNNDDEDDDDDDDDDENDDNNRNSHYNNKQHRRFRRGFPPIPDDYNNKHLLKLPGGKQKQLRGNNNNNDDNDSSSSSDSSSSDSSSNSTDSSSSSSSDSSDSSSSSSDSSSDSSSSSSSSDSSSSSEEDGPLKKPSLDIPSLNPNYAVYDEYAQRQLVENIIHVSRQIGQQLQGNSLVQNRTLQYFVVLTRLVRNATVWQLEKATKVLYVPLNSNSASARSLAWRAYRDATAQAGTGPALKILKIWISTRKVQQYEAANLVSSLADSAILPSPKYLQELSALVQQQKEGPLYQAALLSLSKLTRRACVDEDFAEAHYPAHTYRDAFSGCSGAVKALEDYLQKKLYEAVIAKRNSTRSQLYIRALGQLASQRVAKIFNPYLAGRNNTTIFTTIYQRMLMMGALYKMTDTFPQQACNFAYNVYLNEAEAYEVRVQAVYVIINANPPAAMLQRMAKYTNQDSSPQVVSAVVSAIQSAAALNNPDDEELASNAQAALHLLKPQPLSVHYSQYNAKDYLMEEIGNLAYDAKFTTIGSNDHIVPKAAYVGLNRYLGGMDLPTEEYAAMVSSINKLLSLLHGWDNDEYNRPQKPKLLPSGAVNMGPRLDEPFEAQIRMPIPGGSSFQAFSKQDIADIQKSIKEFAYNLRNHNVNAEYYKLYIPYELTFAVPNVAGYINYAMFKRVSMVQISYHLGGKIESNLQSIQPRNGNFPNIIGFLQSITKVQLIGNVTCKYSTMKYGHIGIIEKITQKYKMQHDAGVEQQVELSLPANLNFTYFQTKQNGDVYHGVNLILEPKMNKKEPLARMLTEPFTTYQQLKDITPLAKSKNKMMVNIRKPQNISFSWGPSKAFLINVTSQQEYLEYAEAQRSKKDSDWLSYLLFPLAFADIQHNQFNISINQTKLKQLKLQFNATRQGMQPLYQQSGSHGSQSPKYPGNDAYTTIVNLGMTTTGSAEKQAYRAAFNVTTSQIRNNDNLQLHYNVTKSWLPGLPRLVEEMKINVQGKWAYMPQYFIKYAREYSPNSNVSFSMYYNNKTNSNPPMQLNGKCRLERSDERLEYVMESPRYKQCREQVREGQLILPACLNVTRRIAVLDELWCEAHYEHAAPWVVNATWAAYSRARQALHPYHSANFMHQGPANRAYLSAKFTPDLRGLSVRFSAPSYAALFRNVSLNALQREIFPPHPSYSLSQRKAFALFRGQNQPMCQLDRSYVNTFDNHTFPLGKLGPCWHVMMTRSAYSAPKENNVTVLVQDAGEHKRNLQVRLPDVLISIVPQDQSLSKNSYSVVSGGNVGVQVKDGQYEHSKVQENSLSKEVIQTKNNVITIFRYRYGSDQGIVIFLQRQNIVIVYDGERVILKAPNKFRSNVHGICGTFTGEPSTDFSDQDGLVLRNPELFTASHLWSLNECSSSAANKYRLAQKQPRFPKDIQIFPPLNSNISASHNQNDDYDSSSDSSSSSSSDSDSDSSSSSSSSSSSDSDSDSDSSSSSSSSSDDDENNNNNQNNKNSNKKNQNNNDNENEDSSDSSDSSDSDSSSSSSDSQDNDESSDSSDSDSSSDSNDDSPHAAQQGKGNNRGSNNGSPTQCYNKRTKLIIKGELYCFTKAALRECQEPCKPTEYQQKEVEAHCIKKGRSAEYFEAKLQRGQNVDFSQKPTTQRLRLNLPVSCGPY